MNRLKNLLLPIVLLVGICLISSCDKEDDDYMVAIDILAPTENAVVTTNEAFTVEVDLFREGDIIHNVAIMIVDSAGNHIQKLEERHVHEADQYTFKKEDVVIAEAGIYRVMVVSTDLHGEEEEEHGHDEEKEHDDDDDDDDDANIQMQTFEVK